MIRRIQLALLLGAVALAFADSSIVVLALPDLLRSYDTSIVGVSLVITVYNGVLAVAAFLFGRTRRWTPQRLAGFGLAAFAAASLACAAAPNVTVLVAARAAQGAAGAALLAGTIAIVRSLAPTRGLALAGTTGAIGAALGPAAGGFLTQAFDWRAIFAVQAPVAGVALLGVRRVAWPRDDASSIRSNAALAFVSGALVGALFLVVVLLIDVWSLSPATAAAVVSALPAGAVAGRHLARVGVGAASGCILVAAGLAALAWLPASEIAWIVAPLAFCGIGLGLVVPLATAEAGSSGIASRHAGLVLGLVLVTPLLTHDLTRTPSVTERAITADVLDARLPVSEKVALARSLARTVGDTRELPDLAPVFAPLERTGADPAELARVRSALEESIRSTATRAFRRSLLLCSALALLAVLPLVRRRRAPLAVVRASAALAVGALALVAAELGAGGWSYGAARAHDPCRPRTLDVGDGLDGFAQRSANRVLDGAACTLGTSREQLVLDAARTANRWLSALRHP